MALHGARSDQSALVLPVPPDRDPLLATFIPWVCVGDGIWQHMRVLMAIPQGPGGALRLGIHLLNEWCHFSDLPHCKGLPHSPSHLSALKESFLDLLTLGSSSTPGRQ